MKFLLIKGSPPRRGKSAEVPGEMVKVLEREGSYKKVVLGCVSRESFAFSIRLDGCGTQIVKKAGLRSGAEKTMGKHRHRLWHTW